MKKLNIVACYLGCIVNFLLSISLSIYMFSLKDDIGYTFGVLFFLCSLLSILTLILLIKSITENKNKITIGILGILFGFIVGGISYFIYMSKTNYVFNSRNSKKEIKELNSVDSTNLEKLIKLRSLYDEEIISKIKILSILLYKKSKKFHRHSNHIKCRK